MSKLEFLQRPLVVFDPSNKEHRRYYKDYLEYGGWGRCPVRFIVPEDIGMDLPTMIKNQLIEYYLERDLGPIAHYPRADSIPSNEIYLRQEELQRTLRKKIR